MQRRVGEDLVYEIGSVVGVTDGNVDNLLNLAGWSDTAVVHGRFGMVEESEMLDGEELVSADAVAVAAVGSWRGGSRRRVRSGGIVPV